MDMALILLLPVGLSVSEERYLLSGDLDRGVSTPKGRQEASQRIAPGIEPCVGVKGLTINGRPSSLSKGFGPEWGRHWG